jgi:hypothetical protein
LFLAICGRFFRTEYLPVVGRWRRRAGSQRFHADVAQQVELLICNQQVAGSSPAVGSKKQSKVQSSKLKDES